ncbi:hypothetical protein, partial [Pseudomonas syringae group genomosp. 3]|uniref:hypothetical protein n=1 Tax=Pseudomonas syringae group genomosp. 3 TaxID=251701 RepID=UPI001C3F2C80
IGKGLLRDAIGQRYGKHQKREGREYWEAAAPEDHAPTALARGHDLPALSASSHLAASFSRFLLVGLKPSVFG